MPRTKGSRVIWNGKSIKYWTYDITNKGWELHTCGRRISVIEINGFWKSKTNIWLLFLFLFSDSVVPSPSSSLCVDNLTKVFLTLKAAEAGEAVDPTFVFYLYFSFLVLRSWPNFLFLFSFLHSRDVTVGFWWRFWWIKVEEAAILLSKRILFLLFLFNLETGGSRSRSTANRCQPSIFPSNQEVPDYNVAEIKI